MTMTKDQDQGEGKEKEISPEIWDLAGLWCFLWSPASFATSWRFLATSSSAPSNKKLTGTSYGSNTSVILIREQLVWSAMPSRYASAMLFQS